MFWSKKKNLIADDGLYHTRFTCSFTNSSDSLIIDFQYYIDIYYTVSASASSLYWQILGSALNINQSITPTGGASGSESAGWDSPIILFGGSNVITTFVNPLRCRLIQIKTTLGGGSSGTVGFFFRPVKQ